jgi:hypothetical protein
MCRFCAVAEYTPVPGQQVKQGSCRPWLLIKYSTININHHEHHGKLLLLQAAVDAWTEFIKRCEVLNVNEVSLQHKQPHGAG